MQTAPSAILVHMNSVLRAFRGPSSFDNGFPSRFSSVSGEGEGQLTKMGTRPSALRAEFDRRMGTKIICVRLQKVKTVYPMHSFLGAEMAKQRRRRIGFIFFTDEWNMQAQTTFRSIWIPILSFVITAWIATVQHWSAEDLAWSFWLAGLMWSTVYLIVYAFSQELGVGLFYLLVLFFFYFIFGGFLFGIFQFIDAQLRIDERTAPVCMVTGMLQNALSAAKNNWPFFIFSGIKILPTYILDARTVNFTDVGQPLFTRDGLRMYLLIFLLTGMVLLQLGPFALYAILLIYFFPWQMLRNR